MIWDDVEKLYGKSIANRMKHSKMLSAITVQVLDNGDFDIPEIDIENAYKDITGQYIHPYAWD